MNKPSTRQLRSLPEHLAHADSPQLYRAVLLAIGILSQDLSDMAETGPASVREVQRASARQEQLLRFLAIM